MVFIINPAIVLTAIAGTTTVVNSTLNTVYDTDPMETVLDGRFSKFYYEVPVPPGSTATWSFATTLANSSSDSGPGKFFTGAWIMREGHPAWQDPDYRADGASMEYRSAMSDPYYYATKYAFSNESFHSDVYYRLLPYGYSKGAINIGTSYPGNIPWWNR